MTDSLIKGIGKVQKIEGWGQEERGGPLTGEVSAGGKVNRRRKASAGALRTRTKILAVKQSLSPTLSNRDDVRPGERDLTGKGARIVPAAKTKEKGQEGG